VGARSVTMTKVTKVSDAARMSGRIARRVGWGVGDQAFSSLTNFALGLLVARAATPTEFGAFSLAFTTYTLAMGASRALATEPLVVRYAASSVEAHRRAAASGSGTALVVGAAAGVIAVLVGATSSGALGEAFLALGISLPGLLLQDSWRFIFFSGGRGSLAFLNDVVWAVVMLPAVAALQLTDHASVLLLTLAWGGAGTLAGCVGALQSRVVPRPSAALSWFRAQRDLGIRYLGEFGALAGARQFCLYAVGGIAGVAAVGGIRAANILFGPIDVLIFGVRLVAIPEAVRILKRSGRRLGAACALLSTALSAISVAWGVLIIVLPDRIGEALLGQTWSLAHRVAVPIAVVTAAGGISAGILVGLRALAAARRSLRARLLVSGLQIVGTIGGAVMGGAVTAAWGLAAGVVAGVPVWAWHFKRGLLERERTFEDASSSPNTSPKTRSEVIQLQPPQH
jgi:O-antigen/teichoic acid export membrane protein